MRASRANLLTVAGLLALLGLVSLGAPRWIRWLNRPLAGAEEGAPPAARAEDPAEGVERKISVKLFFQATDRRGLVIEEREVAFSSDLSSQVDSVVQELVRGSKSGLGPTLAAATKVLHVFVTARGVAYVDLSKEAGQGHPGGSEAELISVYSVVNTLSANFPAIKRVQILIEDRPAATLAGHVDLTRPLSPDMTLLAASALTPAGGGNP